MAIAKVIFNGTTQMDLTSDTVTAARLQSGYSAHGADGEAVSGSLSFVTVYTGSSAPSSGTGTNGDIYLQTGS